ncbi:hypothetical protein F5Y12DRAFT_163341 [Xylaria sp. FL1777]|nr:hypothetical protein F5Y12DRAFT_163341 [Xylaria sp. FL1777]
MRRAVFSALVGLATALPGQVVEQQLETSTVTVAAHPLTFWPLAHLAPTATPLSYGEPPIPSRVPPDLLNTANTGVNSQANANADPHYSSGVPSPPPRVNQTSAAVLSPTTTTAAAAASTTICTVIQGQYPVSTLPAFCRPTLFANAPALASPTDTQVALSTAVVTMAANSVPDKVSCCAECATYYNCFAWRFVPSFVGSPSDRLPGGFDPWRHGNCEIAYHTGDEDGGRVTRKGAPRLCPNGRLRHMLNGTGNLGRDDWINGLFYNGWNEGACAGLGGVIFLPGSDPGVGDGSELCGV